MIARLGYSPNPLEAFAVIIFMSNPLKITIESTAAVLLTQSLAALFVLVVFVVLILALLHFKLVFTSVDLIVAVDAQ